MLTPRDILWVIIVPGFVGLLLSLLGLLFKKRSWVVPLAMALGLLVAFPQITENWAFPRIPPDPELGLKGWIPIAALIALLAGLIDSLIRLPLVARGALALIAAAVSSWLLLKTQFASGEWTTGQIAGVVSLLGIVATIWWACLEDAASVAPTTFLILCWLIASFAAVVISMLATQDFGNFMLSIAAVSAGMAVLFAWKGIPGAARGGALAVSVLMINVFAGVDFTSEVGILPLALLACAPLFVWLGRWTPATWKPWKRALARIIVALIPLITVLTISAIRFHHEQQESQQNL